MVERLCAFFWAELMLSTSPEKRKYEGVTQTSMTDKQFRVMVAFRHIDLLLSMHGEGQSSRIIWSAKATGFCCRDTLFSIVMVQWKMAI